jgi:hypothetical protein
MADEEPIDSERRSLSPESHSSKYGISPHPEKKAEKQPPSIPDMPEGKSREYKAGFRDGYAEGLADGEKMALTGIGKKDKK